MREYILCASIHFDDGKVYEHQPKNITTGFVVSGRRHHNCYTTLASVGKAIGLEERVLRAFDRTENKRDGQLIHNMHDQSNPILISEDLY